MNDIFDTIFYLVTDNPIPALIALVYLLSGVGGLFKRAARRAEEERKRQVARRASTQLPPAAREPKAEKESRTLRPLSDGAGGSSGDSGRAGAGGGLSGDSGSGSRSSGSNRSGGSRDKSPEEIAAEIRRIMGMGEAVEPDPEPADELLPELEREPMPSRQFAARPVAAEAPQGAGAPLSDWSSFSDSKVGLSELGASVRGARPGSGMVGHDPVGSGAVGADTLGTLGGRVGGKGRGRGRKRAQNRLVDLSHPAKAIVMMEIFGPPKGF